MKKIILVSLISIFAVSISTAFAYKNYSDVNNMRTNKVGGLIATWKYIERDVDLSYFYQLDNTVTYKQIEEEIGEPNGVRGSGLGCPYYQVNYNLYIVASYSLDQEGEYNKVGALFLCTRDEVLEKIYPR